MIPIAESATVGGYGLHLVADLRLPMVVVTAGEGWWGKPDIDRPWRASHEAIAAAGPARSLSIAEGSRHLIPKDRPDAILAAVASLIGDEAGRR
ncbi:MAG TPA: hypothetical protein VIQ27_07445 [Gemmatimonadales bacterium]